MEMGFDKSSDILQTEVEGGVSIYAFVEASTFGTNSFPLSLFPTPPYARTRHLAAADVLGQVTSSQCLVGTTLHLRLDRGRQNLEATAEALWPLTADRLISCVCVPKGPKSPPVLGPHHGSNGIRIYLDFANHSENMQYVHKDPSLSVMASNSMMLESACTRIHPDGLMNIARDESFAHYVHHEASNQTLSIPPQFIDQTICGQNVPQGL